MTASLCWIHHRSSSTWRRLVRPTNYVTDVALMLELNDVELERKVERLLLFGAHYLRGQTTNLISSLYLTHPTHP